MIPLALAGDGFDLTQQESKALPTMRSIPGTYSIQSRKTRHQTIRLTSLKAAKELALRVHGSTNAMAGNLAAKHLHMKGTRFHQTKWL